MAQNTRKMKTEVEQSQELRKDLESIFRLQKVVNELKSYPQYRQYVIQHKLGLIDSKLAKLDVLLDKGILSA